MAGVELYDADDGRNGNTVRNSRLIDNETTAIETSGVPA